MSTHPEASEHEFFAGNTRTTEWPKSYLAGLSTARLGDTAYDIHGKRLGAEYRPIIVGRSEANEYNVAMTSLLKRTRGE